MRLTCIPQQSLTCSSRFSESLKKKKKNCKQSHPCTYIALVHDGSEWVVIAMVNKEQLSRVTRLAKDRFRTALEPESMEELASVVLPHITDTGNVQRIAWVAGAQCHTVTDLDHFFVDFCLAVVLLSTFGGGWLSDPVDGALSILLDQMPFGRWLLFVLSEQEKSNQWKQRNLDIQYSLMHTPQTRWIVQTMSSV